MSNGYTELNHYRYERKFVAASFSAMQAEALVRQNSAFFVPVFHPRRVNNIYFDTPGLDCYFDNLFGIGKRWKVRIRWYGDLFGDIASPILEFKLKKGFVGTKQSFRLPGFIFEKNGFNAEVLSVLFRKADLPGDVHEKLQGLQPVLANSYRRSYFSTLNGKFRITIDDNLEYYHLRPSWNDLNAVFRENGKTVLELKYDEIHDSEAQKITNQFPFRLDKNSKFVSGMSYFRNDIPE